MREITRRGFIGGTVGIAAGLGLAGCSASNPSTSSNPNKKVTLQFMQWEGTAPDPIWKQIIAGFEKENPNIKVNYQGMAYTQFFTKLNTQFAAGNAPDVFGMEFGQNYGEKGQLLALQDRMSSVLPKLVPAMVEVGQLKKNGKTVHYQVPYHFVGGLLYGNLDHLEAAGIKRPTSWTLDEFVDACKELTHDDAWGTLVPSGTMTTSFETAFGAAPISADGTKATMDTEEMIAAREFMRDLIYKYKVAQPIQTQSAQVDPFAAGKVSLAWGGNYMMPNYRAVKDLRFDNYPTPNGTHHAKTYAGPDSLSVYAKTPNPDEAVAFVTYVVSSLKAQDLLSQSALPVLSSALSNASLVKQNEKAMPAHYSYFVDQAETNATGWAFVPAFGDIQTAVASGDNAILTNPNSDIASILKSTNAQVQAAIDKNH